MRKYGRLIIITCLLVTLLTGCSILKERRSRYSPDGIIEMSLCLLKVHSKEDLIEYSSLRSVLSPDLGVSKLTTPLDYKVSSYTINAMSYSDTHSSGEFSSRVILNCKMEDGTQTSCCVYMQVENWVVVKMEVLGL